MSVQTTYENVIDVKRREACDLSSYYNERSRRLRRDMMDIDIIKARHEPLLDQSQFFMSLRDDVQREYSDNEKKKQLSLQRCNEFNDLLDLLRKK